MSDRKEITSTNALVRHGTTGVGGIVGGGALLILNSLGGPLAWIIGGVVTIAGVVISASGKEDRLAGGIVAGAGVLTILSGIGLGLGGTLLTLGGLGLLAVGAIGAYKFFKGLRARK